METIRLIYASVAEPGLGYDELMAILRTANDRNPEHGITGMLCYGGGAFMQVLEGERSVVNRLYHHIQRDPRHTDCEILDARGIQHRNFADWSMKLIGIDDQPTAQRRAILRRHIGEEIFAPRQMSGVQAFGFLYDLAEAERDLAA